jgi:hypothetical protein
MTFSTSGRLLGVAIAVAGLSSPAYAEENRLEGWLDASVMADIGGGNFVELQTQQRARGSSNPIGDTQVYRLWLGREIGGLEASAGIHRSKEGSVRETRLMQQASYKLGIKGLKARTRLEQRFVDNAAQTGWRIRQRIGFALPLSSAEDGWELAGNAEGFWTLRATSRSGQTGLTGLRTFLGFERSFGKLDLGLGYTRQQNIREGAPDRVGHAPTLSVSLNL